MAGCTEKCRNYLSRFRVETVDPKLLPAPHISPYLRLAIYVYYILTSGCVYWGWNGIQELLYKAGAFEDVCGDVANAGEKILHGVAYIDCADRASGINNLYTLAYSTHFICSFVGGLILDRFGPRVCFMVGHFFTLISWLLIFCLPRNPWVLRVSFVTIGLFCEACYIPLLSVNKYFPNGNSTTMCIMGSCRSLSYFLPTIMGKIYHIEGFDRGMLYVIGLVYLSFSNLVCLISGSFLIPTTIPVPPVELEALEREGKNADTPRKKLTIADMKKMVKSEMFMEFAMLTCCACLFIPSIEFINKSQGDLLVASGEGGDATEIFKYFNVCTFIPAPFLGALMDRVGPAIVMNFLHLCGVLFYVCVAFDVYGMKVAACACFVFAGSLCVSTIYCYANKRFPKEYFGCVVTTTFAFAGTASLTNIPIYNYGLTLAAEVKEQRFRPLALMFVGYTAMASCISGMLIYISVIRPKKRGAFLGAA